MIKKIIAVLDCTELKIDNKGIDLLVFRLNDGKDREPLIPILKSLQNRFGDKLHINSDFFSERRDVLKITKNKLKEFLLDPKLEIFAFDVKSSPGGMKEKERVSLEFFKKRNFEDKNFEDKIIYTATSWVPQNRIKRSNNFNKNTEFRKYISEL